MATDAAPDPVPGPAAEPGHSVILPPDPARPRCLSEEFALILREFEVETVTLREVILLLHGRGYVLLVMLLALPFCTPVPLPGVSTPFGLIIALIGGRLVLGEKPWLPARLLDTRLPPAIFVKVFAVTRRILMAFERMLRPRLRWITGSPLLLRCHAVPIVICALLLLLPLPIPLSNTFPAWAIMLISAGLLERDGIFIIAGYLTTAAAVAYFTVLGMAGEEAAQGTWQWLAGLFGG
ncbi:MAG: exopolysaccharide biosynthesis protein [Opitutus sp.]|nr:exopolysaccharide biosynthesis protein [Opitutus sp.]